MGPALCRPPARESTLDPPIRTCGQAPQARPRPPPAAPRDTGKRGSLEIWSMRYCAQKRGVDSKSIFV
jgi:hypothetical protein